MSNNVFTPNICGIFPFPSNTSECECVKTPGMFCLLSVSVFFLSFPRSLVPSFQGYTHPREYIVTEWPTTQTLGDLWSLVFDHDCSAVVVLCDPTNAVVGTYSTASYVYFWESMKKMAFWYTCKFCFPRCLYCLFHYHCIFRILVSIEKVPTSH